MFIPKNRSGKPRSVVKSAYVEMLDATTDCANTSTAPVEDSADLSSVEVIKSEPHVNPKSIGSEELVMKVELQMGLETALESKDNKSLQQEVDKYKTYKSMQNEGGNVTNRVIEFELSDDGKLDEECNFWSDIDALQIKFWGLAIGILSLALLRKSLSRPR